MHTKFETAGVCQVRLSYELQALMTSLIQNFAAYGPFQLFLVGSLIHDLIYAAEQPKANDVDLVLFIPKDSNNFLPILSSFFSCPHVPGLYQLKAMGRYKVDLMVVEADLSDPEFLEKHIILKHDFSISSLFCDYTGRIYDPSGRGYKDLLTKNLDLVSDMSLSQVINQLTCLRALKYVGRGFSMSPRLHRVLSEMSYKSVFEDLHFCNLLRRMITHQMSMVEIMARLGFLEKFLDKPLDISSMDMREMHERLVMRSLNLTTIAELKEEMTALERENAELDAKIASMNTSNTRLSSELFASGLKTEPLKMRLSELEEQFSAMKQEIIAIQDQLDQKCQTIARETQTMRRLVTLKYDRMHENFGLKECLQKHTLKSQALLNQQLKQDKAQSQKLNRKLQELKKKNHELEAGLSLSQSQVKNLRQQSQLLSTETQSLEQSLEETKKLVEAKQLRYHARLHDNVERVLCVEPKIGDFHQPFMVLDPHPWDEIGETQLDFIFKYWQEDVLRIPLGMRLATHYLYKRQDYKAIMLLIFCQYLMGAHSSDLSEKIDYLTTKIKLKYSKIYWQIRTGKEWYEVGQQLYAFGQFAESIAFYFLAHQVDKNYIHPVIQIINSSIHLKDWIFLELGLDSLSKFKQPELKLASGEQAVSKYQGHAIKVLMGVYQKLMIEYWRLATLMDDASWTSEQVKQIWDWVAIHRLLHLDIFRENLAKEVKSLPSIEGIYEKILAMSEPGSFSRLMAHLNLATITKDSVQVNLHFKAAVEMNLLPKLETIYAASAKARI